MNTFAGTLFSDHGYHIPSVVLFALALGLSYLGTFSKKIDTLEFMTESKTKMGTNQMAVTKEGAKAAFFAIRKASRVPLHAIVYCNGSNSVGQLHTRVPLNGIQDLVQKKCLSDDDKIIPQNYNQLLPESCQLMIAWEGFVLELTREQACMPCFEMLLVM